MPRLKIRAISYGQAETTDVLTLIIKNFAFKNKQFSLKNFILIFNLPLFLP